MWEDLGKSQWKLLTVKMIWFSGKWWKEAPPLLKKLSCGSMWSHSFRPPRGIFISDNSMKQFCRGKWEHIEIILTHRLGGNHTHKLEQTSRLPRCMWLGAQIIMLHQGGILPNLGDACLFLPSSLSHLFILWSLLLWGRGGPKLVNKTPWYTSTFGKSFQRAKSICYGHIIFPLTYARYEFFHLGRRIKVDKMCFKGKDMANRNFQIQVLPLERYFDNITYKQPKNKEHLANA